MKTYVTPLSSFNGTCATYYKTFERYDYGNMTLRTRIYATFCFDEAANTIYVKDENGVVLFNDGWTMSDLSTSTNQGGGIITKRWASATYLFKFANVWGRPNSGSVTVKVDSAGNPLIAD